MKTLTKTSNGFSRTPGESFDAVREVYGSIQTRLQKRMVERAAEFAREKRSYDLVGDEERVLRHLALALAAIGDRSAVDELGIQY